MTGSTRRALLATEDADETIMATVEVERCARRLLKAALELRQVRQTHVAARDRKQTRLPREE